MRGLLLVPLLALSASAESSWFTATQMVLGDAIDASRDFRKRRVQVRLPTVEDFLLQKERSGVREGIPLSDLTIKVAMNVFGDSIDYSVIRIRRVPWIKPGTAMALGNTIYVPQNGIVPFTTKMHEFTHVWQYQTGGGGYISAAAWSHIHAAASGSHKLAYRYTMDWK